MSPSPIRSPVKVLWISWPSLASCPTSMRCGSTHRRPAAWSAWPRSHVSSGSTSEERAFPTASPRFRPWQRMDDVRAVMDAVGSERAALFGHSERGPMSLLFAATYPERTSALVLYGCFARRSWAPDHPWGRTEDEWKRVFDAIEHEWGGPWASRSGPRARHLMGVSVNGGPTFCASRGALAPLGASC
jgi:pimeloyl-ACP methyl ester carboxylesterase